MKKLLLFLLLITSFTAFGYEMEIWIPCGSPATVDEVEAAKANVELYLARNICKQPEGKLINGVREGKWTWWDKYTNVDGDYRKTKEGEYINGKKEGKWTEWIYGISHGLAKEIIEMNYKNDELHGKWTHYNFWDRESLLEAALEVEMARQAALEAFQQKLADEKGMESVIVLEELETLSNDELIFLAKEKGLEDTLVLDVDSNLQNKEEVIKILTDNLIILDEDGNIQNKDEVIEALRKGAEATVDALIENWGIFIEGNYINGKKEGTWTYYKSGNIQIQKEEIYKDGVLI